MQRFKTLSATALIVAAMTPAWGGDPLVEAELMPATIRALKDLELLKIQSQAAQLRAALDAGGSEEKPESPSPAAAPDPERPPVSILTVADFQLVGAYVNGDEDRVIASAPIGKEKRYKHLPVGGRCNGLTVLSIDPDTGEAAVRMGGEKTRLNMGDPW